jgi:hypothetical protein
MSPTGVEDVAAVGRVRWRRVAACACVLAALPASAFAHGLGGFGGGGSFGNALVAWIFGVLGGYGAVLVLCLLSFFMRSTVLFWVALWSAGLAVLGGAALLMRFFPLGALAPAPLGSAILGLALVLLGRWRRRLKAPRPSASFR